MDAAAAAGLAAEGDASPASTAATLNEEAGRPHVLWTAFFQSDGTSAEAPAADDTLQGVTYCRWVGLRGAKRGPWGLNAIEASILCRAGEK